MSVAGEIDEPCGFGSLPVRGLAAMKNDRRVSQPSSVVRLAKIPVPGRRTRPHPTDRCRLNPGVAARWTKLARAKAIVGRRSMGATNRACLAIITSSDRPRTQVAACRTRLPHLLFRGQKRRESPSRQSRFYPTGNANRPAAGQRGFQDLPSRFSRTISSMAALAFLLYSNSSRGSRFF